MKIFMPIKDNCLLYLISLGQRWRMLSVLCAPHVNIGD